MGDSDGADDGRHLVVDPVEAPEQIKDPAYVVDTFKAHGISTRYYKPAHSRVPRVRARYRIHVFDLRTVAFFRKSRGKYHRVTALTTKQLQRAREMAVRATYMLGLHFACVDVATSKKKFVPIDVNPSPALTKTTGPLYAKAIVAYVKRRQKRWYQQVRRDARRRPGVHHAKENRRDPLRLPLLQPVRQRRLRPAGVQGAGGERIPSSNCARGPTKDPLELVERIRRLLLWAQARTPKKGVRWEAGSLPGAGVSHRRGTST